ncbi:hypothetical protein KC360_g132 [Hortaea werneckii]|nr:hypothetical protein KC360_g132 [Hortaea werneckii]
MRQKKGPAGKGDVLPLQFGRVAGCCLALRKRRDGSYDHTSCNTYLGRYSTTSERGKNVSYSTALFRTITPQVSPFQQQLYTSCTNAGAD